VKTSLRWITSAAAALALTVMATATAGAQADQDGGGGIAIAPPSLQFDDAVRGESQGGAVTLFNNFARDVTFTAFSGGEIAAWVTTSSIDAPAEPRTEFVVPQRGAASVRITVSVPAGTPSGAYLGEVSFEPQSEDAGGVLVGALATLVVNVGGEQRIAASMGGITVENTEVGRPLRVNVAVTNGGNITLEPSLTARFVRQGVEVQVSTNDATPIDAGSTGFVPIVWDTANALPGEYEVEVSGTARGVDLGRASAQFRLAQPDELARSGDLLSLVVVGEPAAGSDATIRAEFHNTGPVAVAARLALEVYRDGDLVDTEVSPTVDVLAGAIRSVEAVVRSVVPGAYRVVGEVDYDGRRTDPLGAEFTVSSLSAAGGSSGGIPWAVPAGGVFLAVAAFAALLLLRRHRRGRPSGVLPAT